MRIVQCFNWRLTDIISNLEGFKNQGFEAIQINPIQPLKEEDNYEWWMSYQPIDFTIGNRYGSKDELNLLCKEAEKIGLLIFADVVINHMGASLEDRFVPHEKVNDYLRNNHAYWRPKKQVSNWNDREDVIRHCIGLPGLNVYNVEVENIIVNFLNELIDCGIMGFRFDAAKSIGLPSEGYRFWPNLIYRLKKYGLFLYGEVIFENNLKILDEYQLYMNVLGNYNGTNLNKMVSFVETHDTFLSTDNLGYTKNMPSREILEKYLNLVREFNNTLFYLRPFDETWKDVRIKEIHEETLTLKRIR